jgi:hypothetical protein
VTIFVAISEVFSLPKCKQMTDFAQGENAVQGGDTSREDHLVEICGCEALV